MPCFGRLGPVLAGHRQTDEPGRQIAALKDQDAGVRGGQPMRYKMEILFPPDSELGVRQRIFQLFCLIAGFFVLAVFIPTDLLVRLPLLLSAGLFLCGLIFLAMLFLACWRGIYLHKSLSLLLLFSLNFSWFFNSGSQGPTSLFFFSAAILFTAIFQGAWRYFFLAVLTSNVLALYYAESFFTGHIAPYATPIVRLQDLAVAVPCSVLICVLMMMTVLGAYAAEQRCLAQAKAQLEATMAEMRVLKGMLPICAACKKIRTKDGHWTQMETYIEQHSHASFTHGLCPKCLPLYMGDNI